MARIAPAKETDVVDIVVDAVGICLEPLEDQWAQHAAVERFFCCPLEADVPHQFVVLQLSVAEYFREETFGGPPRLFHIPKSRLRVCEALTIESRLEIPSVDVWNHGVFLSRNCHRAVLRRMLKRQGP